MGRTPQQPRAAGLAAVIDKALALEPARRYADVTALRDALRPFA